MQREGIFREMKLRRCHEKNCEKKARRKAEAVRRARKQMRKRIDTEGFQALLKVFIKLVAVGEFYFFVLAKKNGFVYKK